jgi:hypothetical protein
MVIDWTFIVLVLILVCLLYMGWLIIGMHETLERTRIQALGISEDIKSEIKDMKYYKS